MMNMKSGGIGFAKGASLQHKARFAIQVTSLTLISVLFWSCYSTFVLAKDNPPAAWSPGELQTLAIPGEGQSVHWLTIVCTPLELEGDPLLYYDIIAQATVQVPGVKMLFQMQDDRVPRRLYLNGFLHSWLKIYPPNGPTSLRFAIERGLIRTGTGQAAGIEPSQRFDWSVPVGTMSDACGAAAPVFYREGTVARWSCDDRKVIFVKRSPVEERFFGHPLALAACLTSDRVLQISGCVYTGLEDPVRLKLAAVSFSQTNDLLTTAFQGGLAEIANDRKRLEEFLSANDLKAGWVPTMWIDIFQIIKLQDGSFSERADAYTKLLSLMDMANERIDQVFLDRDAMILDPLARGFFFEQISWDSIDQRSLLVALGILRDQYQDLEMEFTLFSRFASLGMAANPMTSYVLESVIAGTGSPTMQAAFAAHWGLPVEEEEIAAVAQLLSTAKLRSAKGEAMDVLILLGALDRIPEEPMAMWCQTNLVDASVSLRRRKLAYLMKTVKGRQFLLSKLADGSLPEEVQVLAKSIIRTHVEATQQLKRFDMISEAELQALQAAL